jgi:pyruvate dehydrogenase E2 component (dihydrolipoamide acetyltransferase)
LTEIFKMPDIGEGMAEGEIAAWLVNVGDVVKAEDSVAEVQNDKLLQEILTPFGGKVTKLFVEAGTVVAVGEPLIEFDGDGTGSVAENKAEIVETVETNPTPIVETPPTVAASAPVTTVGAPVVNGRVQAMPSVRRYARQNGIDLTQVPATGRHGHITLVDVKNFESSGHVVQAPVEAVAVAPTEMADHEPRKAETVKVGRVPMTPVRKAIAKNMVAQKTSLPHVTLFDEVEVSGLVAHRKAYKEQVAEQGIKLTYLPYVVKALVAVTRKFPELNAHIDMGAQEIVYAEDYNVGIAVDTPNGLFVPVVKHADQKSILTISKEVADLAELARLGQLKPAEMSGGTITISNIGSARGAWFTPVINVGESAILGLGTIAKTPIVDAAGEIVVGQMMKLSLSFDHRLIDGLLAQSAMNELKKLLGDPQYLLMEV